MNTFDIATPTYTAPTIALAERSVTASPVVWWLIPVLWLLALSLLIGVAVISWCIIHGGGYVVSWNYTNGGGYVRLGCSK